MGAAWGQVGGRDEGQENNATSPSPPAGLGLPQSAATLELSQICLNRHGNPSGVHVLGSHHDFLLLSHPTGFLPSAGSTEAFREPSPATVPIALRSPGFWGPRVTPKLRVGRAVRHPSVAGRSLGGGTFPEAFPLFQHFCCFIWDRGSAAGCGAGAFPRLL